MKQNTIQVLLRVRPLIDREVNDNQCIQITNNTLQLREITGNPVFDDYAQEYQFNFHDIADQTSQQEDIYRRVEPLLSSFLEGYNATIMAYGLTSSGKTYTMFNCDEDKLGIVPRVATQLSNYVEQLHQQETEKDSSLTFSFLQIYNEQISDLLNPGQQLRIVLANNTVAIENQSEYLIQSCSDVVDLLQLGEKSRQTSTTKYNELSSRSHVVAQFKLKTKNFSCKLNLVDLAGSERLHALINSQCGQETISINQSLSVLNKVIYALSEKNQHIPFRDSVLTKLLSDALGGNCLALLITCITPSSEFYYETLNSLRFAERAKRIENKAVINTVESKESILKKMEEEIEKLKNILQNCKNEDERVQDLQDQIVQLQSTLKFGGLINSQNNLNELRVLENELTRKKSKVNLQQTNYNEQQMQTQQKFQLVLQKQDENMEFILQQINQQINTINELGIQFDIESQRKRLAMKILQKDQCQKIMNNLSEQQQKQINNISEMGKNQTLTTANSSKVSSPQQFKLQTQQNIMQNNVNVNSKKQQFDSEEDYEIDKVFNFESQMRKLDEENQILAAKLRKCSEYIVELQDCDGKQLQNQIKINNNQEYAGQKQALLKYFKEQNALINIIDKKIMNQINTQNLENLEKLSLNVVGALKQTKSEYL